MALHNGVRCSCGLMAIVVFTKAGFTRQICDLVVGRQLTAVGARHKLTRCLHDRHGQGQATSSDLDNRSLPLACLPLLAGTDRRRQTASKMAPVGDSSVLRKRMGFICLMACVVAIRRWEKRRMEESNRRMGRPEFIYWALSGCLVNDGVTS